MPPKNIEIYSSIIYDMPVLICRFRKDGTLTFVNKYYCRYFNKAAEELVGHNFFNFIPEEEREKIKNHYMSLNTSLWRQSTLTEEKSAINSALRKSE